MTIDVCIRGAGVVGKVLALLLARQRVRVGLVASTVHAHKDIRSYALNAASRALLEGLRAWPEAAQACPVHRMHIQGDDGGVVQFASDTSRGADGQNTALAWIVDAAALDARLASALEFAPGVQMLQEPQSSALTVICEGKSSTTRAALGVDYAQYTYQQTAIAAHLQTELPHRHTARQWMGASSPSTSQQGHICALLPRGDSQVGNSMALVWSVEHEYAYHLQALDDAAFCAALQEICAGVLGSITITMTSPRATWPLHMAHANRWIGIGMERDSTAAWALAGDAAHTMHPLAGQGLNLGLADVAELAKLIEAKEYFRSYGDMRLLRRYERARKLHASSLLLATDGLQRMFAHDDPRVRLLRNWGMKGFEKLTPLKTAVMRRATGMA